MRRARLAVVGVLAAIVLGGVAAPAAQASTGFENQWSPEACNSQVDSGFKFTLWYHSSYGGAHRNIGYSVWDFADERIGGDPQAGLQPLRYCSEGDGGGQNIKNNAASAQNRHGSLKANVYYHAGYKGAVDSLSPMSSWFQLKSTNNNNASFAWVS